MFLIATRCQALVFNRYAQYSLPNNKEGTMNNLLTPGVHSVTTFKYSYKSLIGTLLAVTVQLTSVINTNCFHNKINDMERILNFGVGIIMCVSCVFVIGYVHDFAISKMIQCPEL